MSARPGAGYDVAAGLARFEASPGVGPEGGDAQPAGQDGGGPHAAGLEGSGAVAAGGKTVLGAALKGALLGLAVVGGAMALDRAPPPPLDRVPAVVTPSAVGAPPTVLHDARAPTAATLPRASNPVAPPATARTRAAPEPPAPPAAGARAPDTTVVAEPAPPSAPISGAGSAPMPGAADTLVAEMTHLGRQRALQDADPAQALALAAEGSRRFPGGTFAQEREAIAITALARLGRLSEAHARAATFLSSYPQSPFAERLRNLTGIGTAAVKGGATAAIQQT